MIPRRLRATAAQLAAAILVATVVLPSPAAAHSVVEVSPAAPAGVEASLDLRHAELSVVPAPGPGEVSLTGTLEMADADDFEGRVSRTFVWLETADGPVTLSLSGKGAERFAHTEVTVIGKPRPDGSLAVAGNQVYPRRNAGSPGASPSGVAAAAVVGTRQVAVIVARYSDQTGYPVTLAQAQDTFADNATASVKEYWETTTRGLVTTTTSVYGQWNLGIPQCPGGSSSYSFSALVTAANNAAASHGVSLASFDHIVIWTQGVCGQAFAGVGSLPGRYVHMAHDWVEYPFDQPAVSAMVAAHEMGHNLGLYHAQGLACFDGSNDQVTLNGTCQSAAYDDEYATMGGVGAPDHALLDADRLLSLGWLDSGEWQTLDAVGTYDLVPTYSATPGVRLLRIARPTIPVSGGQTGAWTIEIRSTLAGAAWDQFVATPGYPDLPTVTTGVSIRYSEDQYRETTGQLGESYLVDSVADGYKDGYGNPIVDFFDAPFQVGETFTDSIGGFTVYVDSVSGSGASVTIGDTMAPSFPLALEGVAIPAGGAQLDWQPASDNLGLDTYQIFRDGVLVGEVPASTLTFTDPPSGVGGTVTYAVRAVDTARNPGPSATADVTLTSPPGPPTGATATAGNAAALVSWTAPAPNGAPEPTSYTATSSPDGLTCTVAAPATSCVVEGLTNGTTYTFTVVAINSVGDGPASDPSNAVVPSADLPGRPTDVAGTPGDGALSVSWSAPADPGSSPITNYTATVSPGGLTCDTAALSCGFSGLTNGTAYTVTVTATNSYGTGAPSEPSAPIMPQTRPDPPQNVVAVGLNGAARVQWDAPAFDGGSPVTAYDLVSSPGGQTCHTTGARSCTVAGLTNRTWYTFTVTATNVAGTSDPSAPSPQAMPLAGATYIPVTPNRIVDSRKSLGVPGKLSHNVPVMFQVTGRSTDPALNIPAGAVAVTGNLTVTRATYRGYFALTPLQPIPAPTTSTLNFQANTNTANGITVPLGPGGTLWVTYEAVSGAKAEVIFDVTGYYIADTSGATYIPVTPNRIVDSRKSLGVPGKLSHNVPVMFQVTGRSTDPALNIPAGAVAVTGNLTVTRATYRGYFALTPLQPIPAPTTSTLNFQANTNTANGITVPLGPGGTLWVTYEAVSGAKAEVIFDVTGYYTMD